MPHVSCCMAHAALHMACCTCGAAYVVRCAYATLHTARQAAHIHAYHAAHPSTCHATPTKTTRRCTTVDLLRSVYAVEHAMPHAMHHATVLRHVRCNIACHAAQHDAQACEPSILDGMLTILVCCIYRTGVQTFVRLRNGMMPRGPVWHRAWVTEH